MKLVPLLLAFAWAVAAAWLDADVFFEYFPLAVCAAAGIVVVALAPGERRAKIAGALIIAMTALVLPHIRWTPLKSFYVDCHAIELGMTVNDARRVMAKQREPNRGWLFHDARILGVTESPHERDARLLFLPAHGDDFDWCIVYPEHGRVARVETSPD